MPSSRFSPLVLLAASLALACPGPARAGMHRKGEAPPTPAALCRAAVDAAEQAGHLPARLLSAIAVVESGRRDPRTGAVAPWPWTINAEGVGHFYDSKEEAIAAAQALQARGVRSIDVGCAQVNLMHHPDAFASLDDAFDPPTNATYAARFLNQLHGQSGDWQKAAAAYHSQTAEIAADYARRVITLWTGVAPPPDAARRGAAAALTGVLASKSGPIMLPAGITAGRVAVVLPGAGAAPVILGQSQPAAPSAWTPAPVPSRQAVVTAPRISPRG